MDYNNNGELFDYIVAKTKQTFFFFVSKIINRLEDKEACKFMH